MAKYRKAIYLDAVPKEKDGKAGYEVTTELGVVSWKEKEAFDSTYILCPKVKKAVAKKVAPKEPPAPPKTEAKKTVAKKTAPK
jgi:hypothetical protein